MAGTFEGLSDLEWKLFVALFPPQPTKRGRGMPPTPLRKVVNTLLYVLITGGRWCDIPRAPQWASKSAAPRWLQRWQADGTLAAMQARVLGLAEEGGLLQWHYGAVDGSFSPWQRRRCGHRTWSERQGRPHPQPHGRGWYAVVHVHDACQWGRAGPRHPAAGCPARPHRQTGQTAQAA
jgi:transposase